MAAIYDIEMEQGATWRYLHTLYVGETPPLAVMDLTGYSAAMQIRLHPDSPIVIASLTSSNGGITVTPLAGTLEFVIEAADSALFDFRKAVYDTYITSPTGEVSKLLYGEVVLVKRVTR